MSLLKGNKIQKESTQITSQNALHLSAELGKCPVIWDLCMQLTAGEAEGARGLLQATLPLCPGQHFLLWSHSEDTGPKLGGR